MNHRDVTLSLEFRFEETLVYRWSLLRKRASFLLYFPAGSPCSSLMKSRFVQTIVRFILFCFLWISGGGVLVAPREPDSSAPGEMGRPVILPTNLTAEIKKLVDDGWLNNAFNQYVSDLISVHRTLPDPRDPWWVSISSPHANFFPSSYFRTLSLKDENDLKLRKMHFSIYFHRGGTRFATLPKSNLLSWFLRLGSFRNAEQNTKYAREMLLSKFDLSLSRTVECLPLGDDASLKLAA